MVPVERADPKRITTQFLERSFMRSRAAPFYSKQLVAASVARYIARISET